MVYFLLECIKRLRNNFHSDENIKGRIFGMEDDQLSIDYANLKKWDAKMKFDVIIGNPPYKIGLHLIFLKKSIDFLSANGQLIFVHPAEWLVQLKNNGRGKKYKQLREELTPIAKSIEFRSGHIEMGVGMYAPITITHLDKMKDKDKKINFKNNCPIFGKKQIAAIEFNCETLDQINPWANTDEIFDIINKIPLSNNVKKHVKLSNGNYFVNLSNFSGNGNVEVEFYDGTKRKIYNMFNIINNTTNFVSTVPIFAKGQNRKESKIKKEIGHEKSWISFHTELEAKNFLNFVTKTKLIKFLIAIYKIDQYAAGIFELLPFFDFTNEWTDDEIYKYFKFSTKNIKLIEEVVNKISI